MYQRRCAPSTRGRPAAATAAWDKRADFFTATEVTEAYSRGSMARRATIVRAPRLTPDACVCICVCCGAQVRKQFVKHFKREMTLYLNQSDYNPKAPGIVPAHFPESRPLLLPAPHSAAASSSPPPPNPGHNPRSGRSAGLPCRQRLTITRPALSRGLFSPAPTPRCPSSRRCGAAYVLALALILTLTLKDMIHVRRIEVVDGTSVYHPGAPGDAAIVRDFEVIFEVPRLYRRVALA